MFRAMLKFSAILLYCVVMVSLVGAEKTNDFSVLSQLLASTNEHSVQRRSANGHSCRCDWRMLLPNYFLAMQTETPVCAEMIIELTDKKWMPSRKRRLAKIKAVYDTIPHDWMIWKRNGTVMFGVRAVGDSNRYHYIFNWRYSQLRLTRALSEHRIVDGAKDRRYFQLEKSANGFDLMIKHLVTQLYVSEGRDHRLYLRSNADQKDSVHGACPW